MTQDLKEEKTPNRIRVVALAATILVGAVGTTWWVMALVTDRLSRPDDLRNRGAL